MVESVEMAIKQDFAETISYKHHVRILMSDAISTMKMVNYSSAFNSNNIFIADRREVGSLLNSLGKSRYKVTAYFFVGSTIDQVVYTYFPHHSAKLKALNFPEVRRCFWWNRICHPKTVLSFGQNWKVITEVADIIYKEFIDWFPREELDDFEHIMFKDEDVDRRLAELFSKAKEALVH